MLLLVLDERVEKHLRDVLHPHTKTEHAVDHVAGLVPFADRVQLSGFVRTQAEIDKAGALARGIAGQVRQERESG